jgi:hypothetical protein
MPGRASALNLVKDSKSIQLIVTGGGIEIMRFSEFYGPERQRELLSEAENQRLVRAATANGQPWLISLKGENMMYRKIVIALIVVGSLVIGYTSFIGSTAQASHNCSSDSTVLAANPELNVACQNDVIVGNETEVLRAIEASAARYSGLAAYYANNQTTNSTFLATNPELMAHNRYALEAQPTQSSLYAANPEQTAFVRTAAEVEWQRTAFPGR